MLSHVTAFWAVTKIIAGQDYGNRPAAMATPVFRLLQLKCFNQSMGRCVKKKKDFVCFLSWIPRAELLNPWNVLSGRSVFGSHGGPLDHSQVYTNKVTNGGCSAWA